MSAAPDIAFEPATPTQRIAQFLGLVGAGDRLALATQVANGLPFSAADAMKTTLGDRAFAHVLPEATYRRVKRQNKPLTRETSEKLYEFGQVFELTLRIYKGDRDRAIRFLEKPHMLLRGLTPLSLATSSSAGADAVRELLNRADYSFAV